MTLAIKLVWEVIDANPCTNFQIRMSIRLAVNWQTHRQTNRQTNGTNSITSTADAGGKTREVIKSIQKEGQGVNWPVLDTCV